MVALLTKLGDVLIAHVAQWTGWKLALWTFGFLQAEYIWPPVREKPCNQANSQANRVDVPRRDFQAHAQHLAYRGIKWK
jgi:hypothetical protein